MYGGALPDKNDPRGGGKLIGSHLLIVAAYRRVIQALKSPLCCVGTPDILPGRVARN